MSGVSTFMDRLRGRFSSLVTGNHRITLRIHIFSGKDNIGLRDRFKKTRLRRVVRS